MNDKKIIEDLYNDWKEKLSIEERPNIWSIIEYGRKSYEIRYSRFLRWLLDPKGNHEIGSLFTNELWNEAKGVTSGNSFFSGSSAIEYNENAWSAGSKAKAEEKNIDVHIYDDVNKRYLAIELKVYIDAHSKQLFRYAEHLEKKHPNICDANKLLLFIKPDGKKPDDEINQWDPVWDNPGQGWECFSYEMLRNVLDRVINATTNANAKKLIVDFYEDLKKSA